MSPEDMAPDCESPIQPPPSMNPCPLVFSMNPCSLVFLVDLTCKSSSIKPLTHISHGLFYKIWNYDWQFLFNIHTTIRNLEQIVKSLPISDYIYIPEQFASIRIIRRLPRAKKKGCKENAYIIWQVFSGAIKSLSPCEGDGPYTLSRSHPVREGKRSRWWISRSAIEYAIPSRRPISSMVKSLTPSAFL